MVIDETLRDKNEYSSSHVFADFDNIFNASRDTQFADYFKITCSASLSPFVFY